MISKPLSHTMKALKEIRKEAQRAKKDMQDVRGGRVSAGVRDYNKQNRGPGPLG
jgi:hypothetical protein